MSRNVFILGAGASKEMGAPLMNDFLDVAANLERLKQVTRLDDFKLVAEGRAALQSTHSKSTAIDIYNMEAVFSAFDMARLLQNVHGFSKNALEQLPTAYKRVIAETLESSIKLPIVRSKITSGVYDAFIEVMEYINEKTTGNSSAITFNYDVVLDHAFNFNRIPIEYGLNDNINENATKLLKLHGSLNWTECHKCKEIGAWNIRDFISKFMPYGVTDEKYIHLPISSNLGRYSHCDENYNPSAVPFIVPPTWSKSEHHHKIKNVWRHAAKELREAENIFIIGYSLPDADIFFHYLFSLGTSSNQIIRRFWVIDPNPEIEGKYKKLLGNAVISKFKFFNYKFSDGLQVIKHEIDQTS